MRKLMAVAVLAGGGLVAAAALPMIAAPAFAASDAECAAMWKKADVDGNGTLSDHEAMRYSAAMRVHEQAIDQNGTISQADFMKACHADAFTERKNDPGAPLKGANSFTESQAKDRAAAQGFTNLSALTKDADGIWRGTAMHDGKSAKIAVDYKGNVVAEPGS